VQDRVHLERSLHVRHRECSLYPRDNSLYGLSIHCLDWQFTVWTFISLSGLLMHCLDCPFTIYLVYQFTVWTVNSLSGLSIHCVWSINSLSRLLIHCPDRQFTVWTVNSLSGLLVHCPDCKFTVCNVNSLYGLSIHCLDCQFTVWTVNSLSGLLIYCVWTAGRCSLTSPPPPSGGSVPSVRKNFCTPPSPSWRKVNRKHARVNSQLRMRIHTRGAPPWGQRDCGADAQVMLN